jgi:mRNA-degrading endonuclease toxin of MazEF toxin-antitoxin module
VLTREEALPTLRNVVVALVTRTVRGVPSEVPLGPSDGMPVECAVSLDNLRTVPQGLLTESIPPRSGEPALPVTVREEQTHYETGSDGVATASMYRF